MGSGGVSLDHVAVWPDSVAVAFSGAADCFGRGRDGDCRLLAVGPWANVAGEMHAGGQIERFQIGELAGDGVFTLSLSAAAALLILWRAARGRASGFLTGLAVVLLLVSAVIGMLNWADIDNMPGVYVPGKHFHSDARAAWGGLATTTFGAAIGAMAMAYQVWKDELR